MRTMKDTERLMIVIRVFLDLHGPATASQIVEYVNNECPVNFVRNIIPISIGNLLKAKRGIGKKKEKGKQRIYWLKK